MVKNKDDWNWDTYTKDGYEPELNRVAKKRTMLIKNFECNDAGIIFKDTPPLHSNWKEIYEHVYKLNVMSVFECGVGACYHLINIHKICPTISINGCDYSQSQINLGYKYFNLETYDFKNNITVRDLSILFEPQKKYEFVYSHAVIMHLKDNKAKNFLLNMAKLSSKYIFLIENWSSNNSNIYHDIIDLGNKYLPGFELIDYPARRCCDKPEVMPNSNKQKYAEYFLYKIKD